MLHGYMFVQGRDYFVYSIDLPLVTEQKVNFVYVRRPQITAGVFINVEFTNGHELLFD